MGMSEAHYEGLSRILRMHLHAHPKGSASHDLIVRICHDIGHWIESLAEDARYSKQQFVDLCSKPSQHE